ncbi:hypothetical protein JCM16303_000874 [Sporobolomyces ruberrimus]
MESSFSFPPARNGSNRPQPQRTKSNPHKSTPYQRPSNLSSSTSSSSTSTSNDPAGDGKWQHDLFGSSSNLYRPSLNLSALTKRIPGSSLPSSSASLRPFGDATPAPQRLINTTTNNVPHSNPVAPDLMTRLGIKGSSIQEQERQKVDKAEKMRFERLKREALRERKELEREREEKVIVYEKEEMGFVVQVLGLVFGTSGEDVQTAFASYGEIKHCFIVDEKKAREGDQLTARITFSRHEEAKTACHKLDGAIADGRPLKVQHVPRSPFPGPLPPLPEILKNDSVSSSSGTASPVTRGGSGGTLVGPRGGRGGGGRGTRGARVVEEQQVVAPVQVPSKMYSDILVESYISEPIPPPPVVPSSIPTNNSNSMDVDMDSVPSGPRGGRGGAVRGGRGGGRMGPQTLPPRQQQQSTSLIDRLNGGGGKQAQVQTGGTRSLAERLGQGSSSTATNGSKGKGKGGKGASTTTGGGGGVSLLDRLK